MLFGIDIQGLLHGAFDGQLNPATLHVRTVASGVYGETTATEVSHNGQGVRLSWETRTAVARGYPMDAVKILLLSLDLPEPTLEDEVTILGDRYRIIDIRKDPVDATFVLAAVLQTAGPGPVTPPPDAEEW